MNCNLFATVSIPEDIVINFILSPSATEKYPHSSSQNNLITLLLQEMKIYGIT